MSGYADGNYSTAYLTSNRVSYPFIWPNNSTKAQFDLEYIQWANTYAAANLADTSADAPSAYLVEQGPVEKIGGGCVKFKRIYCQVPATWGETQQMAYTYPGLSGWNGSTWNPYLHRAPITLYAVATVTHTFSVSASPPTLDATFQVTDHSNVVDYIGATNPALGANSSTSPSAEPATYNVSSASHLLRGLIWEKVSAVVPKPV